MRMRMQKPYEEGSILLMHRNTTLWSAKRPSSTPIAVLGERLG